MTIRCIGEALIGIQLVVCMTENAAEIKTGVLVLKTGETSSDVGIISDLYRGRDVAQKNAVTIGKKGGMVVGFFSVDIINPN